MSIEIYPVDFSTRYEINHAISLVMTVLYNGIGKLTLVAPIDDYNIKALRVGNLLYDTTRDITYWLECANISVKDHQITANGYTANWMLNKRCILNEYRMVNIESGCYKIVNDNLRGLSRVQTADAVGLSERTDAIFKGGQILDEIMPYLEEKGLGQKMEWNPDTLSHTFRVYKGVDRTQGIHAVVFSDEQGTAQDLVIDDDDSTLCNVAYVTGKLKDDVEFLETIGDATGDSRRELWLETSVTQENEESGDDCKARARAYGFMELGKHIRRKSFDVVVDASDLGKFYNLGDIVSCVSIRFGVSFNARITELKYTMDANKTKTEITLGDPTLTALEAMKLNG